MGHKNVDDEIGRVIAPARYNAEEREAIDVMRDACTDEEFMVVCRVMALKYRLRRGQKGPAAIDGAKESWYLQMAEHVEAAVAFEMGYVSRLNTHYDPRCSRPDFQPYERHAYDSRDG